jgi:hypothetical protein
MILGGAKDAVLVQVRMLDIHGTYYYDIVYAHTGDSQQRSARIGKEDIYENPQPGDEVRVAYTMNVATGVQRREN